MNQESMMLVSTWGVCILIGLIGVFFLVMTYALIKDLVIEKKSELVASDDTEKK